METTKRFDKADDEREAVPPPQSRELLESLHVCARCGNDNADISHLDEEGKAICYDCQEDERMGLPVKSTK